MIGCAVAEGTQLIFVLNARRRLPVEIDAKNVAVQLNEFSLFVVEKATFEDAIGRRDLEQHGVRMSEVRCRRRFRWFRFGQFFHFGANDLFECQRKT